MTLFPYKSLNLLRSPPVDCLGPSLSRYESFLYKIGVEFLVHPHLVRSLLPSFTPSLSLLSHREGPFIMYFFFDSTHSHPNIPLITKSSWFKFYPSSFSILTSLQSIEPFNKIPYTSKWVSDIPR